MRSEICVVEMAFPNWKQYGKWSLPSKWSFWGAVVGLPVGVISLIIAIPPLLNKDPTIAQREEIAAERRNNLVFRVAQDLRYSSEWLQDLASSYEKRKPLPSGSLETKSLLELVGSEYRRVVENSYGEEKYIYQLAVTLSKIGGEVASLNTRAKIQKFDQVSTFTLHDVIFLVEFLRWYLRPMMQKELSSEQLGTLGWVPFPRDKLSIRDVPMPRLKYFVHDGKPIEKFLDYLGLVD